MTVDHGAVALLGTVDHYAEKWAAETAANGSAACARSPSTSKSSCSGPTSAMTRSSPPRFNKPWTGCLRAADVTAEVRHSQVTLTGQVNWHYQFDAAERAVRNLKGVIGVSNSITVTPEASAMQVKELVEAALQRQTQPT